jgi:hypothetical protein
VSSISPGLLRSFFRAFSRLRVVVPTSKGNQYEFFTFLNVCLMAKRARLRVSMTGHKGKYVVRSSPGNLGGPYGYAILTTQNSTDYELHNGIEIDGQSGMKHEADLLLLGARERRLRVLRDPPFSRKNSCGLRNVSSTVHPAA